MSGSLPQLHYPLPDSKEYVSEYIPGDTSKLEDRIRQKLIHIGGKYGREVHWWHMRHELDPTVRKQIDLHFIQHVQEVHNGEPELRSERRYYNRALAMYGREIDWLYAHAEQPIAPHLGKNNGGFHDYYQAYWDRWLNIEMPAQWLMLYHGVSLLDYLDLMEPLYLRLLGKAHTK